jgi:hypothetical protein
VSRPDSGHQGLTSLPLRGQGTHPSAADLSDSRTPSYSKDHLILGGVGLDRLSASVEPRCNIGREGHLTAGAAHQPDRAMPGRIGRVRVRPTTLRRYRRWRGRRLPPRLQTDGPGLFEAPIQLINRFHSETRRPAVLTHDPGQRDQVSVCRPDQPHARAQPHPSRLLEPSRRQPSPAPRRDSPGVAQKARLVDNDVYYRRPSSVISRRNFSSALVNSRDTCICEMPTCSAISACVRLP